MELYLTTMADYSQALPHGFRWEDVHAYAETRSTNSLVAYASSVDDCQYVLQFARRKGFSICPRGNGYTYGDMILNDGHVILDTSGMNKIINWDVEAGLLTVQPGVRIGDILQIALPAKWTLNSCPGGPGVSIGGAVSNNVHGKDSWRVGNFGKQVVQGKLLTARGDIIPVDPRADQKLFSAIVGGMGLLGVLVEITLQLRRIPSAYVEVSSTPARNIGELIGLLEEARTKYDFFVAWVDAFSSGAGLGRGYVTGARWIDVATPVDSVRLTESVTTPTRLLGVFPAKLAWRSLRPFFGPRSIRVANTFHYVVAALRTMEGKRMLFSEFNFMHSKIPDWKHIYRPYGFLEFQPIIPSHCGVDAIAEVIRLCQRFDSQSLLCGVKAHSPDGFMLSYSGDGYSMGVDLQLRGRKRPEVETFARCLFDYTLRCGGKVFLAKDELLPRDVFREMYPQHHDFLVVKRSLDAESTFMSDMYRRLFI